MAVELNDFRSMMGKYNLGNLVIQTDSAGNDMGLAKVNNARVFKSARATASDPVKNQRVRDALFTSITSYLSGRGVSAAANEYLNNLRTRLLGENTVNSVLSRNDVANILDELDHRVAVGDFKGAYQKGIAATSLKERAISQIATKCTGAFNSSFGAMETLLEPAGNGGKLDAKLVKLAAERAGISEQRVKTYLTTRLSTIMDKATLHLPHVKFARPVNGEFTAETVGAEKLARNCIADVVRELHLETTQIAAIAKLPETARKTAAALRGDASIPVKALMETPADFKSLMSGLAALAKGTKTSAQVKFGGVDVTLKAAGEHLSATIRGVAFTLAGADELLDRIMSAIDAAPPADIKKASVEILLGKNAVTELFAGKNVSKSNMRYAQVSKWLIASFAGLSETQLQALSQKELCEVGEGIVDKSLAKPDAVREKVAEYSAKRLYSPEMLKTISMYGDVADETVVFGDDFNRGVQQPNAFDALAADLFSSEEAWLHDRDPDGSGERIKTTLLNHLDGVRELLGKDGEQKIESLEHRLGVDLSAPMKKLRDILNENGIQTGADDELRAGIENLDKKKNFAPIETTIKDLLKDTMDALQKSFAELVGDGLVKGRKVETWKMTLDELVQDMKKSGDTSEGKFFAKAMGTYLTAASESEKRAMLASLLRLSPDGADQAAQFGALLKGAGPVFQKLLQGVSESEIPPKLKGVFADMKSNLAPIPKKAVNAMLRKLIAESKGDIKSITVEKTLGSASVGQAFLCRIKMANGGERSCVVKMLKPDVQNRFAREVPILKAMAREVDGGTEGLMFRQLTARLETIGEELNFKSESEHLCAGTQAYGDVSEERKSVASNRMLEGVPPDVNILALELVEGDTVDKFLSEKIEGRIASVLGDTELSNGIYMADTMEACMENRRELAKIHDDLAKCQKQLMTLAEHWFETAVFKSGFFHGDLHAGNIMIGSNLDKITMIDFGNAMQIKEGPERNGLTKLVCYAAARDVGAFITTFEGLLPPEQKDTFNREKANLTAELNDIFRKGSLNDTGSRLNVALSMLERKGFNSPKSIYNFIQSQTRLQNAIEEVGLKMQQVKALYDQQSPKSPYTIDPLQNVPWAGKARLMFGPYESLRDMPDQGSGGSFVSNLLKFQDGGVDHNNWTKAVGEFLDFFKTGEDLGNLQTAINEFVIPMNRTLASVEGKDAQGQPFKIGDEITTLVNAWEEACTGNNLTFDKVKKAAKTLLDGLQAVQLKATGALMHPMGAPSEYGDAVYKVIEDFAKSNGKLGLFTFAMKIGLNVATKLQNEVTRQEGIANGFNKVDKVRRDIGDTLFGGFVPSDVSKTGHWNIFKATALKIAFSSEVEGLLASPPEGTEPGAWAKEEAKRKQFAKDWLFNVQNLYKQSLLTLNNPGSLFYDLAVGNAIEDLNKANPDKNTHYKVVAERKDGMIWHGDKSITCEQFVREYSELVNTKLAELQKDKNYRDVTFPSLSHAKSAEMVVNAFQAPLAVFVTALRPNIFDQMSEVSDADRNEILKAGRQAIDELPDLTDAEIDEMAKQLFEAQRNGTEDLFHTKEAMKEIIRNSYKDDLRAIFTETLNFISKKN